jgi:hypothetical protein
MLGVDPLLAFLSGVGVSLFGALVANILTRHRDRRRVVEERRFDIYMKLMELHSSYFWFTVAEVHRESVKAAIRQKCRDLSWQCADMLRSADEVDFLDEILDVTLSPRFTTAVERYEAMGNLLDRLGKRVNPRYARKIREMSQANLEQLGRGSQSNAPGATSFLAGGSPTPQSDRAGVGDAGPSSDWPRPFDKRINRWSVYIDIEGFSSTYAIDSKPLVALGALMTGIYDIGSRCYRESPNRIFAHQLGDGFIVVGEFRWPDLTQACSVAIALLRIVLMSGGVAKASIAEGEHADVTGCYPPIIRELHGQAHGGAFPIGAGRMTVLPVMGTALINAYRLLHADRTPSGALLVVQHSNVSRLPPGVSFVEEQDFAVVDWLHASYEDLNRVLQDAALITPSPREMESALERYIAGNAVSPSWTANSRKYLGLLPRAGA